MGGFGTNQTRCKGFANRHLTNAERIVMIEKYAFQMTACDTYYANVLLNKWVLQPHKTIIDLHLSGVSMRHVALCECIMYCNVKSSSYPVRHMASNHSLERC